MNARRRAAELTARASVDTAFKQQRLKAWQPILTPKTVLPTFFLVAIIFAPIGAVLYYFSNQVNEFTIDYTECSTLGSTTGLATEMPAGKYNYQLKDATPTTFQNPAWAWLEDAAAPGGHSCRIEFSVPSDLTASVFLYYKLTNYYQNHRRYVKSLDTDQLLGRFRTVSDLNSGTCKPVDQYSVNGTDPLPIWPCGLIANSVFNGESWPTLVTLMLDADPHSFVE